MTLAGLGVVATLKLSATRLAPGARLALYLDTERRVLAAAHDACPEEDAVLLLAVLQLGDDHPLPQMAAGMPGLVCQPFPELPPLSSPRWVCRALRVTAAGQAAVAAAIQREKDKSLGNAARVVARGIAFKALSLQELAAAVTMHTAVADMAEKRLASVISVADTEYLQLVVANSRAAADAARAELALAHAAEEAYVEEAATSACAAGRLDNLPSPPQPRLEALHVARLPDATLLRGFGGEIVPPFYPYATRRGLDGKGKLTTYGFSCLQPTPKFMGEPRLAVKLRVCLPGALGESGYTVARVPANEFVSAAVAVALCALMQCCNVVKPPVGEDVLRVLFGCDVVDALRALPARCMEADCGPLRMAAEDALLAIFEYARRAVALQGDAEARAACCERIGEWTRDMGGLLDARVDGQLVPATHAPVTVVPTGRLASRPVATSGFHHVRIGKPNRKGRRIVRAHLHATMGVNSCACPAKTVEIGALIADEMRIMTGAAKPKPGKPDSQNFQQVEYPGYELLPRMPQTLARRGKGYDTPELRELRDLMGRQAIVVAYIVAAGLTGPHGFSMSVRVREALEVHAHLQATDLRAMADFTAASIRARALEDWLVESGQHAWRPPAAPVAPMRSVTQMLQASLLLLRRPPLLLGNPPAAPAPGALPPAAPAAAGGGWASARADDEVDAPLADHGEAAASPAGDEAAAMQVDAEPSPSSQRRKRLRDEDSDDDNDSCSDEDEEDEDESDSGGSTS